MAFSELICDDSDAAASCVAAAAAGDGGAYAAVVVAVVGVADGCDDDDDDDAVVHPPTYHSLSCVPLVWPMLLMNWLPSLSSLPPLSPPSTLSIVSV